MPRAGTFQTLGLSLAYSDPLVKVGRTPYLGELRTELTGYSHEVAAMGGYTTANIEMMVATDRAEDWYENGLGRHLEVYSADLNAVWEGFVDVVGLRTGGYSATRGPLSELGNRVMCVYTYKDTHTDPPATISNYPTALADNTDSQALYGIWEKTVSGGETDTTDAERLRDTWLRERAWPSADDPRLAMGTGAAVEVSLECQGYWKWLDAFPYDDTNDGTVTCTTKVQYVLAADPNGVISQDFRHVATNAVLAPRYEGSRVTGWAVLKGLAALGGGTDDRWTLGLYNGRRCHYQEAPEQVAYQHRLTDPSQRIETIIGGHLYPWQIRPGQWLYLPDFLVGRTQPNQVADRYRDPRFMFVERVRFQAPFDAEVTGTRAGRVEQILAKMSGKGVAA